jgi:Delta6-protoilludene synthase
MYSYNVEQARGDDTHNVVTVVMNELNTDINGAMRWIAKSHAQMEKNFMAAKAALPKWGKEIDEQVAKYVEGVAYLVRANDAWSFESERYFGKRGREVEQSRAVALLPKLTSIAV